jgi:copper chaperone CopZ
MKSLFLISAIVYSMACNAQVSKVSLQASGLTCSMCSNSIYKSLKTISFVDKIEPNIKTSTFEITFKPGNNVDFDKLKSKVEDAGYAIAKFMVTVKCSNIEVKSNETVKIGDIKFRFLNVKDQSLNGEKRFKILNKGFIPSKEYKKVALATSIAPDVYLATI